MNDKDMNMKKDNKNSRPLNSVHTLHTLGMDGGYQCVAQLSLSQVMVFFWLFAFAFSREAMPYILNTRKLA